ELIDIAAHLGGGAVLEQSEHRQRMVSAGRHRVAGFAAQHRRHMADAPALPRAGHGREDLLAEYPRRVDAFELTEAPVAGAAGGCVEVLAEVLDERAMAAPRGRRVPLH